MLRPMGTTNVNPLNGVPFGQEKTREDYLARSAWEYDQASRLRAARHPVGYQALAEGHERAAREYERAAENRPSVPRATVSPRTPLQEKMRKKLQRSHATKRPRYQTMVPSIAASLRRDLSRELLARGDEPSAQYAEGLDDAEVAELARGRGKLSDGRMSYSWRDLTEMADAIEAV